jgi:hypothetical protein
LVGSWCEAEGGADDAVGVDVVVAVDGVKVTGLAECKSFAQFVLR